MTIEIMLLYFGTIAAAVYAGIHFGIGSRFINWSLKCAYEEEWSRSIISKMNSPSTPKPKKEGK